MNLKQKIFFNFHEGFFRKSPFCTFSCIKPGFGGPWVMIRKKILIAIFIMLQKNNFGQKKFWISCTGSKVPFWQKWIRIFFWPKVFFWSIMKMAIKFFFRIMTQGPPNPGFMQEKVQKGDFLKKPSRKLKNIFCFRFEWIPRRPGTLN